MTIVTDDRTVTKKCDDAACSTEFTYTRGIGRPKMWCDVHARRRRNGRPVTILCASCGAEFETDSNRVKRYSVTYCSRACMGLGFAAVGPHTEIPEDHPARWYGTTCEWKPPAPRRPSFFANTCDDCGASFVEIAHGVPSSYCSTTCTKRVSRRRRRAREHNAPGQFTMSQLMRQYAKQGYACAYCKQDIEGMPDPEHVNPLSRGGRNDMSNLVAACRACNTDKSDLTLDEWAVDRVRRGLPTLDTALSGSEFVHLMRWEPTTSAWRDKPANKYSKVA